MLIGTRNVFVHKLHLLLFYSNMFLFCYYFIWNYFVIILFGIILFLFLFFILFLLFIERQQKVTFGPPPDAPLHALVVREVVVAVPLAASESELDALVLGLVEVPASEVAPTRARLYLQ